MQTKKCQNCNSIMNSEAVFCEYCGIKLPNTNSLSHEFNQTTTNVFENVASVSGGFSKQGSNQIVNLSKSSKKKKWWIAIFPAIILFTVVIGIGCTFPHTIVVPVKPTPSLTVLPTTESTAAAALHLKISNEEAELQRQRNDLLMSRYYGLRSDGTIVTENEELNEQVKAWNQIVSIKSTPFQIVGIKNDGSITVAQTYKFWDDDFGKWTNIKCISTTNFHNLLVGVRHDGSVVVESFFSKKGYSDIEPLYNWREIIDVALGEKHYVGLKKDGRVIAAGSNAYNQKNVGKWNDIVAIAAGSNHTVGLKSDGSVVATGNNSSHQCDINDWTNIISIAAGSNHTVGLLVDGTVMAIGSNEDGQCEVSGWRDIIAIAAIENQTLGMKRDGSIVIAPSVIQWN